MLLPSHLHALNHGLEQVFQERPNVRSTFSNILVTAHLLKHLCTFSNHGRCQAKLKPAGKRTIHATQRVVAMYSRSALLGNTNSAPARVDQGHNLQHVRKRGAASILAALSRMNAERYETIRRLLGCTCLQESRLPLRHHCSTAVGTSAASYLFAGPGERPVPCSRVTNLGTISFITADVLSAQDPSR